MSVDYLNAVKVISEELKNDWMTTHNQIPNNLYHYTTAEGLLGILNSNSMWATNASYLNDASELIYARDLVCNIIYPYVERDNSPIANFFAKLSLQLQCLFIKNSLDVYVVCFCENGDLLSQWRGYGFQGGGYSIGFRIDDINFCNNIAPKPKCVLRKVIYDRRLQEEIINLTLIRASQIYAKFIKSIPKDKLIEATNQLSQFIIHRHLVELLFSFKSAVFSEENEWRVVFTNLVESEDLDQLKFRSISGKITPYIDIDFSSRNENYLGKLPIDQIIHGPTLHPELTRRSLELLLRRKGYKNVEVIDSGIPLRT